MSDNQETKSGTQQPQSVHIERSPEPAQSTISPELQQKHEEAIRQYPHLNLSEKEYVISEVKRHRVGVILPIAVSAVIIILILAGLFNYSFFSSVVRMPSYPETLIFALGLSILCAVITYIIVWIFISNKFYLTNEAVIQRLQSSLFSKREQAISLAGIEDASLSQDGIWASLIGYGTIRLSTVGDEQTYILSFVANPKDTVNRLNSAVEAFKNGRPIT